MKKKIIHGLLASAVLASTSFAATVSQTFIAARPETSDNTLISRACKRMRNKGKDAIGAVVSAAAFYRQSYNNVKLAQYFGDGTAAVPTGLIGVALNSTGVTGLSSGQIDPQASADKTSEMYGSVALNPRRIEAGAQLQWSQSLSKLVDGLSFDVSAPVVYVRTSLRPTYTSTANSLAAAKGGTKGLADFFGGNNLGKTGIAIGSYATLTQNALANAIISSAPVSTTQVADVKLTLGYDVFKKKRSYRLGALVTGTVPTGNKSTGVYLFEPIAGTRNFTLGGGLEGWANLFRSEDGKTSFNIRGNATYSYGFGAKQVRTLGMTNYTNGRVIEGQYVAVGQKATATMMPLANVSTLAVKVTPRSRVEATAGVVFNYDRFAASVSYNLLYNQAEKVELTGAFDQTLYGVIGSPATGIATGANMLGASGNTTFLVPDTYTGGAALSPTGPILAPGLASSTSNALSTNAATTPQQVVHKVGGDLSYGFGDSVPVRAAVGGEVELSSNNASINSWGVWAKVGVGF